MNNIENKGTIKPVKTRRLSPFRVLVALALLGYIGYQIFNQFQAWDNSKDILKVDPWFASYVDVTATPQFDFEQLGNTAGKNVVLSFIVASSDDSCTPTWGNAYTLNEADEALDLNRRIARLRQLGGDVAVSFGGLLNNELSLNCLDQDKLVLAYESVINKYGIEMIDLDLEGESLSNQEAVTRLAKAISFIQSKMRQRDGALGVWLTLPVIPQGLTEEGTRAIAIMLKEGVDLAGVNIMVMNYGDSKNTYESLVLATKSAMQETHRQLGILYVQDGTSLSSESLWGKIGITPMIGQNDLRDEVFNISDAVVLNEYAAGIGVMRVSMWSANRDVQCGDNYVNLSVVSDSCSGVKQNRFEFLETLSRSFTGTLSSNAAIKTEDDGVKPESIVDDPSSSPYQIWNDNSVYLEGTKVVWRRNVYQAKWWTQGDLPDNPVLQSWQTPWHLIGPVLEGEKPLKLPTLPKGTYPSWDGLVQYDEGDRVMFRDVPYQAKWWTQGDSPAAASADPTSSPWAQLTYKEIEEVIEEFGKK
ncbi:MAG TPA: glycosyl hydrolase family 18 [Candidatus Dojkabacteria bacterium]|nr:glycosyl hydrolase family 18 [Candidatus Dojkabacteria bacterium]